MWHYLYKLASPKYFFQHSGRLIPWFAIIATILCGYGLIGGLIIAPADFQQGDAYRIIYIHVPSAFLSLFVYSIMAFCAALLLIWRIKLADIIIAVSAPLGAWFTLLALITGSIWGKPMWGTWWIWDARLTSELILLFLYLGIITFRTAIRGKEQAKFSVAILVLVGFVDIPLIHYSVDWWNTLHQGATLSKFARPSIAPIMLYPLLAMVTGFLCYFVAVMLYRARYELLYRERDAAWVATMFPSGG